MSDTIASTIITPEVITPRTGLVLMRIPGCDEWTEARYPAEPGGFGLKDLQKMGGGGFYESIRLNDTFAIICNEDGRTLKLPVSLAIALPHGGKLSIFGQFAVVRIRRRPLRQQHRPYIGLRRKDVDHIKSAYPWLTKPR